MKILVPVKRVVDYNVKVRVKPDGTGRSRQCEVSMNPFDEIAVEEALRLKEAGKATEVVVVRIGRRRPYETFAHRPRHGRRPGHPGQDRRHRRTARGRHVLAKIVAGESPDLIIMGKQAIDDDSNAAGQMLAELLGWPQATFASKVELSGDRRRRPSPVRWTAASRR